MTEEQTSHVIRSLMDLAEELASQLKVVSMELLALKDRVRRLEEK